MQDTIASNFSAEVDSKGYALPELASTAKNQKIYKPFYIRPLFLFAQMVQFY